MSINIDLSSNNTAETIDFIQTHSNKFEVINCLSNWGWEDLKKIIGNIDELVAVCILIKRNNSSNIKEYIEEYKPQKHNLLDLLETTNDPDYIKKYIERREEYHFDTIDVVKLIVATHEPNYIKDCIAERKKFGFGSQDLSQLIGATNDKDYIKSCIKNSKNYELSISGLCGLINFFEDKKDIEEQLSIIRNDYGESFALKLQFLLGRLDLDNILTEQQKSSFKISLPELMKFGIEIETIGECIIVNAMKERKKFGDWEFKHEPSITSTKDEFTGIEITSSILTGNTQQTTNRIKSMCTFLHKIGNYVNETCGGHIHFDSSYLDSKQAWINFIQLYAKTEHLLYIISNKEGEKTRPGVKKHAKPFSDILYSKLDSCIKEINALDDDNYQKAKNILANIQGSKNYGINFLHPNTIEFRFPNGSLDPDVWIQNINLFGGIIKAANNLAIIQAKPKSEITESEKKYLQCFENILGSNQAEDPIILEQLFELAVPQEDIELYRRRYQKNNAFSYHSPSEGEQFKFNFLTKPAYSREGNSTVTSVPEV